MTAAVAVAVVLAVAAKASAMRPYAVGRRSAEPRTVAVVPAPVSALMVDGRRLAWWIRARATLGCELQLQVFDRDTHRLATLRPNLNCEIPTILGTALAGNRVLYAVGASGLSDLHATVATIAIGEPRPHLLTTELSIERDPGPGDLLGYPARVAGGEGTLAYLAFAGGDWPHLTAEAWRLTGRKPVLIPYAPRQPISIAVTGRHLAAADSTAPTRAVPNAVDLRDTITGDLIRSWQLPGVSQVWLSTRYLVARAGAACYRYDIRSGARLGSNRCRDWTSLAVSRNLGVYRVGRRIRLLDLASGRTAEIARATRTPVGPVIAGDHVFWAETRDSSSRIRELVVH